MKQLAIIIPMYNEEDNAEKCVRQVSAVINEKVPGARLFAVNDGSKDNTESILKGLESAELPLSVVTYEQNKGYGGALATGMKEAHARGYEYGLVMDSDLTNDPNLIPKFAEVLSTGQFDVIKASRYIEGGGMQGVEMYRQLFTIYGNIVASLLFNMGIKDCTNGFHAVRLSLLANEDFNERGFPFLLEELYVLKKKGARGAEIPYTLTARQDGEGVSKFSYKPEVLWSYFKYALKAAFN
ncbi:MAG: glycosyltransferase [Proteobacteria bacterium]|nr:glycosyltransferase [Pseudomonadota bacterium]